MAKVISCRFVGERQAYDIQVDHVDHQFYLKNGVLTSNCSHAAAYSVVTMQNANLATYHPLEFYAALLTKGQAGELQDYVSDIKKAGVKILPVDVNCSKLMHSIEDGAIRLSLLSVLGVGASAATKIVTNQPYSDFFDFVQRSGASKTSIHPLILCGALDSFGGNTRRYEKWYEHFLSDPKHRNKTKKNEQAVCWDDYVIACNKMDDIIDYPVQEKVAFENTFMGFSIRGSPFEILDRKEKIEKIFDGMTISYKDAMESEEEVVTLPVAVREFKERADRKKNMMAFIKFAVESGEEFEAPAFSTTWKWIATKCRKGAVYVVTFNRKKDDPQAFIVGKPGWAHSEHSCAQDFINIDEIEL